MPFFYTIPGLVVFFFILTVYTYTESEDRLLFRHVGELYNFMNNGRSFSALDEYGISEGYSNLMVFHTFIVFVLCTITDRRMCSVIPD